MIVNNETVHVEQDKLKSWLRLLLLFSLGVIGTVGMLSLIHI